MNFAVSAAGRAALIAALPASLALTRGMIAVAQKRGWVAKPKADRWHQKPTALFGGVSIVVAFLVLSLAFVPQIVGQLRYDLIGLLLSGAAIFLVGLRDDIKPLNPHLKMVGQAMSLTPYLVGMLLTHKATLYIVTLPLTIFWCIAMMNSLNMLDNMDGLSAGVSATFGLLIAAYGFFNGAPLIGSMGLLLSLACLGFLAYNLRAKGGARIFMGDCGSMFLGMMAAGLTVSGISVSTPELTNKVLIPLLLLAVPIFDTTLVVIIRKREHRSVSQGGRDHSSHRLVYSGRSEKQAVLMLIGLEALVGIAALYSETQLPPVATAGLFGAVVLGFRSLGINLARYTQPTTTVTAGAVPNSAVVRDARTSRASS